MGLLFGLIGWIVLSLLAAALAHNKGRSGFVVFLVSLVFSPLIGLIAAAVMKPNSRTIEKRQMRAGEMKKCPFCAELVRPDATVCRYCGKEFPQPERKAYVSLAGEPGTAVCSRCRKEVPKTVLWHHEATDSYYHKACLPAARPSASQP